MVADSGVCYGMMQGMHPMQPHPDFTILGAISASWSCAGALPGIQMICHHL